MRLFQKDSGLLALLPTPKQTATFTPAETPKPTIPPKSLIPQSVKNAKTTPKVEKSSKETTDGDDEIGVDFFSLSKVDEDVVPVDLKLLEIEIDQFRPKSDLSDPSSSNCDDRSLTRSEDTDLTNGDDSAVLQSRLNLDEDAVRINHTIRSITLLVPCKNMSEIKTQHGVWAVLRWHLEYYIQGCAKMALKMLSSW